MKKKKGRTQKPARASGGGRGAVPVMARTRHGRTFALPPQAPVRAAGIACRMVRVGGTYGFAQPLGAAARQEDIFIPGRFLKGALPGDEVRVALSANPRREGSREGEVLSVGEGERTVTGVVEAQDHQLWLRPDFCSELWLRLEQEDLDESLAGQKVVAVLRRRGKDYDTHLFAVSESFGDAETAAACAGAILKQNDVRVRFPEKVLEAAENLRLRAGGVSVQCPDAASAHFSDEEMAGRLDLRGEDIFTIDSADTKDIDDAVSITPTRDGWQLGVHIADVSHYVRPQSPLDKEALARGTSVYYADQVVPMLPPQLSNDLCSLNAGVDRLAFSCLMQLDRGANVTDFHFAKTVIRSRVKGVYSEINRLLDGDDDPALREKYAAVAAQLPALRSVYDLLAEKRRARGSMDIESGESKLILDENGRCIGVKKRERGVTECIIEECMILANGCAARLAREKELPFVYRVHTDPEAERVETLRAILGALGVKYQFAGEIPTQQELSALLDEARGSRLEPAVHTAILRTMAKADYRPQPLGHYGLGLKDYAHFTSPIRRYPDLAIHRILSAYTAGESPAECRRRLEEFAANAAQASSDRELAAMTAERDCEDCYKAEYMKNHLDEVLEGTVTSVTAFGLYVMLDDTVEGLVRADALSAGELLPIEGVALEDPLTGRRWAVGDRMAVRVASVNVPQGQIDFVPPEGPATVHTDPPRRLAISAAAPRAAHPAAKGSGQKGGGKKADLARRNAARSRPAKRGAAKHRKGR